MLECRTYCRVHQIVCMSGYHEQKLVLLKSAYEIARDEKDYGSMVKCGREYYEFLRKGEMTEEDKEALQNDILVSSTQNKE